MEQKSLAIRQHSTPAFVDNAMQSIENMMKYASTLLASGLCPSHFYEKKDNNGIPVISSGKPEAVVMVLQHGFEVGLSPMQALQQVIPVNGLVSIKGDGAKSLIFGSGVLFPNSWVEKESGSIKEENYTFSITAKRKDNGMQLTRTFSVNDAKRAGLWITKDKIEGKDGWKWKKSAWYKYPDRMVRYRCLGFIARDLFSDVLAGMYTSEEAQDLPQDTEMIINTPSGATITIPDQDFDKNRSQNITSKAASQIDKRNKVEDTNQDIRKYPVTPEESTIVSPEQKQEEPPQNEEKKEERVYGLDELNRMKNDQLLDIIGKSDKMKTAVKVSPRKNTSKKFREIIMGYQNNKLDQWIDKELKEAASKEENSTEKKVETPPENSDELNIESMENEEEAEISEITGTSDIEPNVNFEAEKKSVDQSSSEQLTSNKFDIVIPEIDPSKGQREFDDINRIYNEFSTIAGINNRVYDTIIAESFPELGKEYREKEDFITRAPQDVINKFLNSVEKN